MKPTKSTDTNLHPYHLVATLHDSRTSQRMIDYRARQRRFNGTKPFPDVIYMTKEEEEIIAKTVKGIVFEKKLDIVAFNVCRDHIHILIKCNIDDISKIMHMIKGRTSRVCNQYRRLVYKGIIPLETINPPLETTSPIPEKAKPFWTQKFSCTYIKDSQHYWNTINYIQNNRVKHKLPKNPVLENIIASFVNGIIQLTNN
jgi:REP element-mobilizing transposase RayT